MQTFWKLADKRVGNISVEGTIAPYIYITSVFVEANNETDLVVMNAILREFASDIAMQIAANLSVNCVSTDGVCEDIKREERDIEMQKEDFAGKLDNMKEETVEGRLRKRYERWPC